MSRLCHPFPPVFDENSRMLLLGSFPSPASREKGFFYLHPQNRFWPVLSAVLEAPLPQNNEERRELLLSRRIALWDVLAACDISGADDSSIRNAVPNDLSPIFSAADIRAVFTTGQAAFRLYKRFQQPKTNIPAVSLPSTSPANAKMRLDDLVAAYKAILPYLS